MSNHRLIASGINGTTQIFLDRWDYETYIVSVHKAGEKTTHEYFDTMTSACYRFFKVCSENGIQPKKES
jgi:hypothetical protein